MPLTTIELANCSILSPWNGSRGYGDGRPPLLFLFRAILDRLVVPDYREFLQ